MQAAAVAGAAGAALWATRRALAHRNAPGNPLNVGRLAPGGLGRSAVQKRALRAFYEAEKALQRELGAVKSVLKFPVGMTFRGLRKMPHVTIAAMRGEQWVQHTVITPAAREACVRFWIFVYDVFRDLRLRIDVRNNNRRNNILPGSETGRLKLIDELVLRLLRQALQISRDERDGLPHAATNAASRREARGLFFWKITQHHIAKARDDVARRYLRRSSIKNR